MRRVFAVQFLVFCMNFYVARVTGGLQPGPYPLLLIFHARHEQRWRSAEATRLLHAFCSWDDAVAGGVAERSILNAREETEKEHAMAMAALRRESERERDEVAARLQAQVLGFGVRV